MDITGASDPYVKLKLFDSKQKRIGKKKKTSVKSCNLNPYWNESFVFIIDEMDMKRVTLDITVSINFLIVNLSQHQQTISSSRKGFMFIQNLKFPICSCQNYIQIPYNFRPIKEILIHFSTTNILKSFLHGDFRFVTMIWLEAVTQLERSSLAGAKIKNTNLASNTGKKPWRTLGDPLSNGMCCRWLLFSSAFLEFFLFPAQYLSLFLRFLSNFYFILNVMI